MGVDTEFYMVVGIKGEYNDFRPYKSKNDPFYTSDLKDGSINSYKNIIFEDYLPNNYEVISDGMCCEYSIIGKVLQQTEYIDEILSESFTIDKLVALRTEVYDEIKNLGIKNILFDDIQLHIFTHFS